MHTVKAVHTVKLPLAAHNVTKLPTAAHNVTKLPTAAHNVTLPMAEMNRSGNELCTCTDGRYTDASRISIAPIVVVTGRVLIRFDAPRRRCGGDTYYAFFLSGPQRVLPEVRDHCNGSYTIRVDVE